MLTALLALPAAAQAKKAPDFKIAQVLGAPVGKISGLAELKGKVVFLEFWATWCGPCVAGIPRTNRLIETLSGQPVVFLSVTDEPAETIAAYLKTHEMKAWVGLDAAHSSFDAYKVHGRPDGYLIGKDGTLLARVFPDNLQESDVRDALAGKFKPRLVNWPQKPSPGDPAPTGKTYFSLSVSPAAGKPSMSMGSDLLEGGGLPFADMVAYIWDILPDQVILDTTPVASFNFSLKTPDGAVAAGREVLKSAVLTAFGVLALPESKELDGFVLALSTQPGAPRPEAVAASKYGMMAMGGSRILGDVPMPELAQALWMSVGKPVLDETGLGGSYHIDLEWDSQSEAARDRALAALGLRLEPARRQVPQLRIVPAKK